VIYFFYGKATFLAEERIADLSSQFLKKNATGNGYFFFDCGDEPQFGNIINALSARNLFAAE
jgi:DNA polymerase III delta subunit